MKKKTFSKGDLWKHYEKVVHRLLGSIPNAMVKKSPVINGRKFDFSVNLPVFIPFSEYFQAEFLLTFGGDCKLYGRPIDVKIVDGFRGMLEHAGLQVGIIVSELGFSKGAEERAKKAGIILLRFPWDLSGFIQDEDLDVICVNCPAESEDSSPGMIDWNLHEFSSGGFGYMTGQCQKCGTFFAHCFDCGVNTGFYESDYDEGILCTGKCGRIYIAGYDNTEYFYVDSQSFDSLEVNVLRACFAAKQGLSEKKVHKIIDRTKWRFWTVGNPLIRLHEENLVKQTSAGLKTSSEGKDLVKRFILKARRSYYNY